MRSAPLALLGAVAVAITACGSDDDTDDAGDTTTPASEEATDTSETPPDGEAGSALVPGIEVTAGAPFPDERCALNEEAGTITFLTGFDFAAASSIVDVIVAEQAGLYDELCLDVEVRPSFSTANYPLIAENQAQFASGGSFSEVVQFAAANDADFRAVSVEGRTPIDVLITKTGVITAPADLEGMTLGVKGKLPSSIAVMLLEEGLAEGTDFDTVLLDGFDPAAHIAIEAIVGFPGWKSNEPGQLERAGIPFDAFDPVDVDIPGSFGAIYTNQAFLDEHPTAAEDFVRATMRGLADAVADPTAAANTAVDLINENGNPNFLSPEGEVFRWETESALITETTPDGTPLAMPTVEDLQVELDTYAGIGLFGEGATAPDAAGYLALGPISAVYDDTATVIWPG